MISRLTAISVPLSRICIHAKTAPPCGGTANVVRFRNFKKYKTVDDMTKLCPSSSSDLIRSDSQGAFTFVPIFFPFHKVFQVLLVHLRVR